MNDKIEKLARTVAKYAPMLGAALPIPGGAAIGSIIAAVFGAEDPAELEQIIAKDPQSAIKLREIETKHRETLETLLMKKAENELVADTSRLQTVNETIRAEALSGDKWTRRWRPFWGYSTAIAFFLQVLTVMYVVVFKTSSAATIIMAFTALDVFWAVPLAILGIAAYHRGKEKRVIAGEDIKPFISFNKKEG